MALNPQISYNSANAACDAVVDTLDTGLLRIYDGTQPATCNSAVAAQVLLAELTLNATAFGDSTAGVATANAITDDSSANAKGTASWFRVLQAAANTAMFDGSVGTATANLVLNSVSIQTGATVSVTALTFTVPIG